MGPSDILRELETVARRLGVTVRFDAFDDKRGSAKGGLCRLRGQAVIVVDEAIPVVDKVAVLAEALCLFDLETVYVPPLVRQRIQHRGKAAPLSAGPRLKKARPRG